MHDERGMWFYSLVGRFRSVCLIVCPSVGLAVGLVGWLVGFFYGRRTKTYPIVCFVSIPVSGVFPVSFVRRIPG